MSHLALIDEWVASLDLAITQQDWEQIEGVNSQVAEFLANLPENALSATERLAMQGLKECYQRAYECCGVQQHQLKDEIARMRAAQDGITAYAMMAITAYQDMAQHEEVR
ncbi:hypothetical protein ACX1G9_09390 [Yersinia enterocolitica]|uniref:hypothetical protein n=1 Tax=Yersinia enterocolitica TaxID=630 RepID=UPI003F46E473